MDTELYELLTTGFTYEKFTGRDAYGNKTYATAVAFNGRYEGKRRSMGSSTSGATLQTDAEVTESGTLITEVMDLQPGSRVTVPGGLILYVTSVETETDEVGPYYQEATLEERQ